MKKILFKSKINTGLKKKCRWILTFFVTSSIGITPIISLTSCVKTESQISDKKINIPDCRTNFEYSSDLTAWIANENKKDISTKISDLFTDNVLNATNTSSIEIISVKDQVNKFKISVSLNPTYIFVNNQKNWISNNLDYHPTVIKIMYPKMLTGNKLEGFLEPIDTYVSNFQDLNLTERVNHFNSLFGISSSLNLLNTQSIDVKHIPDGNNQIQFSILLNQGFTFAENEKNSYDFICTYSQTIPADFTIGAYSSVSNEEFQNNFNKLASKTAKLNWINSKVLTQNVDYIDRVEVVQQNQKYGYLLSLVNGCSFSSTSDNGDVASLSTQFFPFNGTGNVISSIPVFASGKTVTSSETIDEFANFLMPHTDDEMDEKDSDDIDDILQILPLLSGEKTCGLSSQQVSDIKLTTDLEKSTFTFAITLKQNSGLKWTGINNSNICEVSFKYAQIIQKLTSSIFYSSIILSANQTTDQFVESFIKNQAASQIKLLVKNQSDAAKFSKFIAEKFDENNVTFTGTISSKFNMYDGPTYKITIGVIAASVFKNFLESIHDKYVATTLLDSYQIGDFSVEMLADALWNNKQLLTPALRKVLVLNNFILDAKNSGSLQFNIDTNDVSYVDASEHISPKVVNIENYSSIKNVVNTFNEYTGKINDIAKLVDSFAQALTKLNQGEKYSKINLKSVLYDVSVPLTDIIIKHTSIVDDINEITINSPETSFAVPRASIQNMICSFFQNKTVNQIIEEFDNVFPQQNDETDQSSKKIFLMKNVATKVFNSIKQVRDLLDQSLITNFIKAPIITVFDVINEGMNNIDLLVNLQPLVGYLLMLGNVGSLDILGGLPSFVMKSGLVADVSTTFDLNIKETDLKIIYDNLYPFVPVPTNFTNYPTNENDPVQSSISNDEAKKASIGFDIKNCAYVNLVSPEIFIKNFIDNFLNYSNVAKITPELFRAFSMSGIVIDPSNINKFVEFQLNNVDQSNPYLTMNITEDPEGQIKITNNVTTYLSLKNLTAVESGKNWFGNPNYQGGLFNVSLYDTLLGNKEFVKAFWTIGASIAMMFFSPQIAGSVSFIYGCKFSSDETLNNTGLSTQDPHKIFDVLNGFIDRLNLNGMNVYNFVNSCIGKIEQSINYKFAETSIANNKSVEITYDRLLNQYIYNRTYNFGTVDQPNVIGMIDLTSTKTLLGDVTVLDIVNIARLFIEINLPQYIPDALLAVAKVKNCLSTAIVIPPVLWFKETLTVNARDTLNNLQNDINVEQIIDLTGMNDLFDNIFGINIGGKNVNKNSMFNGLITTIIGLSQSKLSTEDGKAYVFDNIKRNLNIPFLSSNKKNIN